MSSETFSLPELAVYLQRDARELEKLAKQDKLPGRRHNGEWRFHRADVHQWLDQELPGFTDAQLVGVEVGVRGINHQPLHPDGVPTELVAPLLDEATIALPMRSRTAPGILQELVELANGTWQIYEPDKLLAAVRQREEQCSTALPGGVAVPHPRRVPADSMGEAVLAFGKTTTGIPFGGERGALTDLFFLLLCPDERQHLRILARLARMFQRDQFLEQLRAAVQPADVIEQIQECEAKLSG